MRTSEDIREAVEAFLGEWDRQEWLAEHGEWASEHWRAKRTDYSLAVAEVREALDELPRAEYAAPEDLADLDNAVGALRSAAHALVGQVLPNEGDYIAEGTIDPDCLSGSEPLGVSARWSAWDCTEGWAAYRNGSALVLNWWRAPTHAQSVRHARDLWLSIDDDFFADD